jgi:hypothetical protein
MDGVGEEDLAEITSGVVDSIWRGVTAVGAGDAGSMAAVLPDSVSRFNR